MDRGAAAAVHTVEPDSILYFQLTSQHISYSLSSGWISESWFDWAREPSYTTRWMQGGPIPVMSLSVLTIELQKTK